MSGCTGYPVTDEWPIWAYPQPWSVSPGQTVALKVSTTLGACAVTVVRLPGPGRAEAGEAWEGAEVEHVIVGAGQHLHTGSAVLVPGLGARLRTEPALIFRLQVRLTLCRPGPQGLLSLWDAESHTGLALTVEADRCVAVRLGDGSQVQSATSDDPLLVGQWHSLRVELNVAAGRLEISHEPMDPLVARGRSSTVGELVVGLPSTGSTELLIGACGRLSGCGALIGPLNADVAHVEILRPAGVPTPEGSGKAFGRGDEILAAWDLGAGNTRDVPDRGPHGWHGTCLNTPARAIPDGDWRGASHAHAAGLGYAAMAFHEDDLTDAGWQSTFTITVPDDARSGVYAFRLRGIAEDSGHSVEIPFFVRPRAGSQARLAVLLPSFTYQAYANDHHLPARSGREVPDAARLTTLDSPFGDYVCEGIGLSTYDRHADGCGVMHSSRLRPALNMSARFRAATTNAPRQFSADLLLLEFLETEAIAYDVVTDEDLDGNPRLLDGYAAVCTGSHPEYVSETILDSLEDYVRGGGNVAYLGGDGFWMVTSTYPDAPHVVEVRRGFAGTRTWDSRPGEEFHASTGERGGTWRHRGRSPHRLFGVGLTAQGSGRGSGYTRTLSADDAGDWGFVFDGIPDNEVIGSFGLARDGAACDEVDRADPALGTPPGTISLARAHLGAGYAPMIEDVGVLRSGSAEAGSVLAPVENVRADMVIVPHPGGGTVFSVGSMGWCTSLPHADFRNNVATVTRNVLQHFLKESDARHK